ncbi:hypothetical protein [Metamycoplasma hominis]|nr:hypothetical protein [Metamycoplasma hominis]
MQKQFWNTKTNESTKAIAQLNDLITFVNDKFLEKIIYLKQPLRN